MPRLPCANLGGNEGKAGGRRNPVRSGRGSIPWISLGVAAAAGFIGTTLVIPSREQQALAKLAAIEAALKPKPTRENHDGQDKSSGGGQSMVSTILRELLATARPLLLSLLTTGFAGKRGAQINPGVAAAASDPAADPATHAS